jgi:S-adenosylmethionine decarboxylase
LSESSLFVGSNKVVLKTCGTTTLLNCLDKLEEYGKMCGSEIEFVLFSRKNFNFPEKQQHPHTNFEIEVSILNKKFPDGLAHVLGPVHSGGDHHFVFFSHPLCPPDSFSSDEEDESSETKYSRNEVTLEVLMSQLDPAAMAYFIRDTNPTRTAKETTKDFGLSELLGSHMLSDEVLFEPCGYSLNAINTSEEEDRFSPEDFGLEIPNYATIHITPEPHCSFVSFETNLRERDLGPNGPVVRAQLVEKVISLYRPGRFSVVASSVGKGHSHFFKNPRVPGYSCRFKTHYEYEQGFQVTMMNFTKSTGSSLELGVLRSSQSNLSTPVSQ